MRDLVFYTTLGIVVGIIFVALTGCDDGIGFWVCHQILDDKRQQPAQIDVVSLGLQTGVN